MRPHSGSAADVDQAFRRYCRGSSAEDLALVFDALAPDLRRVAAFLTRSVHDAEEIVQETFLAAMRSRTEFDPSGEARKWFDGILQNRVLALQTKRQRRAVHDARLHQDALREEPRVDPRDIAQERELRERIDALYAELGASNAEPLRLHLEHGWTAEDVARHLGRPAGTVRTQIARGKESLRRRLPDGVMAGFAPWNVPDSTSVEQTGLEAVRARVLAAARSEGAPLVGTAAGIGVLWGILAMKKTLIGMAALAAGLVLVVGFDPLALPRPVAAVQPVADVTSLQRMIDEHADATVAAERSPVLAEDASGERPGSGAARVCVTVRWKHDRSVAAGVGVSLDSGFDPERRDAVTSAAGLVEWTDVEPGRWKLRSTLSEAVVERAIAAGEDVAVELIAERRATVTGRVLDDAGQPVEGASVWVSAVDAEYGHDVTQSDRAGRFVVAICSAHAIGARKAGHAQSKVVEVAAADGAAQEIVLRLSLRRGSLCGVVRDALGTPLPGAWVMVGPSSRESLGSCSVTTREALPRGEETRTDAAGRFAWADLRLGWQAVIVWGKGYAPVEHEVEVRANHDACLDVVVMVGATVTGQATNERGEPVPDALVRWYGPLTRWARTDSAGRYALEDLAPGDVSLNAVRNNVSAHTRVHCAHGRVVEWNPRLETNLPIGGRVVRRDGSAAAGMTVLVNNEDDVVTDEQGRFLIEEAGFGDVRVSVRDGHATILEERVAAGRRDLVLVVEEPTASFRGTLVDDRGRPVEGEVFCYQESLDWDWCPRIDIDQTGAFRIGPIRAGKYQLDLISRTIGLRHLGSFVAEEGRETDIGIALPAASSASFFVTIDGQPVDGAWLDLWPSQFTVDFCDSLHIERGRATAEHVSPGRLRISVKHRGFAAQRILTVPPGVALPCMHIELARVTEAEIRVHHESGRSFQGTLTLRSLTSDFAMEWSDGHWFRPDLPAERFVVTARHTNGMSLTRELDHRLGRSDPVELVFR